MTLQFLIGMIVSAVNDRLHRKLHYVEEESRVCRSRLGGMLNFYHREAA